jgi:protein O-GlcNAc transferase
LDDQIARDLQEAVRMHRNGSLFEARQKYMWVLDICPQNSDALHLLGVVEHQRGDVDKAIQLIRRAVEHAPDQPAYYLNLGNAYRDNRIAERAAACYQLAIDLKPDYAEAYFNLANTLADQGKIESAIGNLLEAVSLNPNLVEAHLNLGQLFEQQESQTRAMSSYQMAFSLKPDCADACIRLGSIFQKKGDHRQAVLWFRRAAALNPPDCYRIFNNMGASHRALGNRDEAVNCFKQALDLKSDYAPACYNLGVEYHLSGQFDRSIEYLQRALAVRPDHAEAANLLVHLLHRTCAWQELQIYGPQLDRLTAAALKNRQATAEAVYTNVLRHSDPSLNYTVAKDRSRKISRQVAGISTGLTYDRSVDDSRPIVLGYFSADFRNHPIGHLVSGLFGRHDRKRFVVNCYSYGEDDDSPYRRQIMADCDRFVDVRPMSGRDIAGRISEDRVCILIDLMGHTAGSRLDVCALRPAPVQVTYLGFPGTSGADFFDYIITDKIVSPPEHAPFYSEQLAYMPHCYQINNNCQEISGTGRARFDFGLPDEGFVFSSFNQAVKIDPVMFSVWLNLLKKIPGSVLWLLWDNEIAAANLKKIAAGHGIRPDRLIFAEKLSKADHLARMRLSDLALDTRIYGGHTTTSDALWAGVPVIALLGHHFASRVSSSLLLSVGLGELVAGSLDDYEALALDLARNPVRLNMIRRKLARYRCTAPLFDTGRFVKNLESAFMKMWDAYRRGEPPRKLEIVE